MYDNYSIFKDNNLYGLKNESGEIIIRPTYLEMYPFSCGLSLVRDQDYRYAYITHRNAPIFPFGTYDWCEPQFVKGFARVVKGQKWGIINIVGIHILPIAFDRIWPLNPDYLGTVQVERNKNSHRENLLSIIKKVHKLSGLKYLYTIPIEAFKGTFGIEAFDVKADRETGIMYSPYPGGRIEVPYFPSNPIISLVVNEDKKAFLILHNQSDTGKSSFERTLVKKEDNSRDYYSPSEGLYDNNSYLDDLMEDAFEGDMSNYWNID